MFGRLSGVAFNIGVGAFSSRGDWVAFFAHKVHILGGRFFDNQVRIIGRWVVFRCCRLRYKRDNGKVREEPAPLGYKHDGPDAWGRNFTPHVDWVLKGAQPARIRTLWSGGTLFPPMCLDGVTLGVWVVFRVRNSLFSTGRSRRWSLRKFF